MMSKIRTFTFPPCAASFMCSPFTCRPPLPLGLPHQKQVSNVQRALDATMKKPFAWVSKLHPGQTLRVTPSRPRSSRRPARPPDEDAPVKIIKILGREKDQRPITRQTSLAKGRTLLCTRICPFSPFEVTPLGAAPGPPVKTGARVRRFRGCYKRNSPLATGKAADPLFLCGSGEKKIESGTGAIGF